VSTVEEFPAKTIFHRLDPCAHGRLGNVQIFRSAIEIATIGYFQKSSDMIDFHGGSWL
jgi:hypothetical protein